MALVTARQLSAFSPAATAWLSTSIVFPLLARRRRGRIFTMPRTVRRHERRGLLNVALPIAAPSDADAAALNGLAMSGEKRGIKKALLLGSIVLQSS